MRIILKKELFQTPNVSWDNEVELPRMVIGVLRRFVRLMAMRFRRRSVLDREKLKERTGPGGGRRTMGRKLVRQRVVHYIRVT